MDSISQTGMSQILSKKCSIHGKICLYLYIGNESSTRRKCKKCIENIPQKQIVEIEDIFNFNPLTSSPIFEHLKVETYHGILTQMQAKDKNIRATIKTFFKKFYKDVQESVAKIVKQSIFHLDSFPKVSEEENSPSKQAEKVYRIQNILKQLKPNEDSELDSCILAWNSEDQTKLSNNLEKIKQMQQSFSVMQAEEKAKDILKLIDCINLYNNQHSQFTSQITYESTKPMLPNKDLSPQLLAIPLDHKKKSIEETSLLNQSSLLNYFEPIQIVQEKSQSPISSANLIYNEMTQFPIFNCQQYFSPPQIEKKLSQQPQTESLKNVVPIQIEKKSSSKLQAGGNLLSKMICLPSKNFEDSSKMKIQYSSSNISFSIFNTSDQDQQCYLNTILSNNTNYLVSLTFNHQKENSCAYFSCGLISQNNKDTKQIGHDNIYFYQRDGGKVNKIVKGNNLKSGNFKGKGMYKYEIHLNIKHKLFRICSVDYKNCQELENKSYFDENKKYSFAFHLANLEDSIVVHKISEVSEFPDIMMI